MPANSATRSSSSVTRLRIFSTKMSATIATTAAKTSMFPPAETARRSAPASASASLGRRACNSGSSASPKPQARRRALGQHLAAETNLRSRPPAGRRRGFTGRLDQRGALDQTAEILFVQHAAGDRLDRVLQFGERELG